MINCSCVYVGYDPVNFYHEQKRMARKEHICNECSDMILPGQIYLDARYKNNDVLYGASWITHKVCPSCHALIEAFFCDGYVFGSVLESLHEHIQDHLDPYQRLRGTGSAT
jgi:hypothetical protein